MVWLAEVQITISGATGFDSNVVGNKENLILK
jgi:hypothetical protein